MKTSHHARHLGTTDPGDLIRSTIVLRRRVGHHPIPKHHHYVNCPHRPRLDTHEFAARYGAAQHDIDAVTSYCAQHGLTVVSSHAARRHVEVTGRASQINAAFGVELQDFHHPSRPFHLPNRPAVLPDHLKDVILHVDLGEEPKTMGFTPPAWTNQPANTPQGGTATAITPAQVAALYQTPNDGTGQTLAILIEYIIDTTGADGSPGGITPTNLPYGYSRNDVQLTLNNWGVAMPTLIDIAVDGLTNNTGTTPAGEWVGDIVMAAGFAPGATIAIYFQGLASGEALYARVIHPEPGDPICHTLSLSAVYPDEASYFSGQPTAAAAFNHLLEDAALQNVTVLMISADYGSGGDVGDGKAHAPGSTFETALCIGGTTLGNVVGNSFVEWLWSQSLVGNEATFLVGAGGGASAFVPLPPYQANAGVPVSLNNGFVGRGVPDICAIAAQAYTVFFHGAAQAFGGTSQSAPSVNGMLASINKALGRPVGFLNPTLYANAALLTRDINPTTSAGGPQTNANGLGPNGWVPNTPGYPVTNGFDCCTGLGVLRGNALVTYLQSHSEPAYPLTDYDQWWVRVQAFNTVGASPLSGIAGPDAPTPRTSPLEFISSTPTTLTIGWSLPTAFHYTAFSLFYAIAGATSFTASNAVPTQASPGSNLWRVTITGLTTGTYTLAVLPVGDTGNALGYTFEHFIVKP